LLGRVRIRPDYARASGAARAWGRPPGGGPLAGRRHNRLASDPPRRWPGWGWRQAPGSSPWPFPWPGS